MVDPYTFLQQIRACEWRHVRAGWAALALRLYYPQSASSFDVADLVTWTPVAQAVALGAISWSCARRGGPGYELDGFEVLTEPTMEWLSLLAAGVDVADANRRAGNVSF